MNHAEHHIHDAHRDGPGYETSDASLPTVLTAGIVLTVFVVVVIFGLLKFYGGLAANDQAEPEPVVVQTGPGPKSPSCTSRDQMLKLRAEEEAVLTQYGWVDRQAKVVRVPIDRAIDLVAERGVPAGQGPKTEVEVNSHAGTPAPPPVPGPLDLKSKGTEGKK